MKAHWIAAGAGMLVGKKLLQRSSHQQMLHELRKPVALDAWPTAHIAARLDQCGFVINRYEAMDRPVPEFVRQRYTEADDALSRRNQQRARPVSPPPVAASETVVEEPPVPELPRPSDRGDLRSSLSRLRRA